MEIPLTPHDTGNWWSLWGGMRKYTKKDGGWVEKAETHPSN